MKIFSNKSPRSERPPPDPRQQYTEEGCTTVRDRGCCDDQMSDVTLSSCDAVLGGRDRNRAESSLDGDWTDQCCSGLAGPESVPVQAWPAFNL